MPLLVNRDTGQVQEFAANDMEGALRTGWAALPGVRYNVFVPGQDEHGSQTMTPGTVGGENLTTGLASGRLITPTVGATGSLQMARRANTAASDVDIGTETEGMSAVLGATQAASFGFAGRAMDYVSPGAADTVDRVATQSPYAHMSGAMGLDVISTLATMGGAPALEAISGLGAAGSISRLGRVIHAGVAARTGSRLAGAAARGVVEGGALGAVQAWIASSTHNEDLTAQGLLADAGLGAVLGLGMELGGHLLGQGARRITGGRLLAEPEVAERLVSGHADTIAADLFSAPQEARPGIISRLFNKAASISAPGVRADIEALSASRAARIRAVEGVEAVGNLSRHIEENVNNGVLGEMDDMFGEISDPSRLVESPSFQEAIGRIDDDVRAAVRGESAALAERRAAADAWSEYDARVAQEAREGGTRLSARRGRPSARRGATAASQVPRPSMPRPTAEAAEEVGRTASVLLQDTTHDILTNVREELHHALEAMPGLRSGERSSILEGTGLLDHNLEGIRDARGAVAALVRARGSLRGIALDIPSLARSGATSEARGALTAAAGKLDNALANSDLFSHIADAMHDRFVTLEGYMSRREAVLSAFGLTDADGIRSLSATRVQEALMSGKEDFAQNAAEKLIEFGNYSSDVYQKLRRFGFADEIDGHLLETSARETRELAENALQYNADSNALARIKAADNGFTGFQAGLAGLFGHSMFGAPGAILGGGLGMAYNAARRPAGALAALGSLERMYTELAATRGARFAALRRAIRTGSKKLGARTAYHPMEKARLSALIVALRSREARTDTYNTLREEITSLAADPSGLAEMNDRRFAPLYDVSDGMPGSMAAASTRAIQYLAMSLPPANAHPLTGVPLTPSMGEMDEFLERVEAIHDPYSLVDRIIQNRPSQAATEAVAAVLPDLYTDIAANTAMILQEDSERVDYQTRLTASTVLNQPLDDTLQADFVESMQMNYAQTPQQAQAIAPPGRRLRSVHEDTMTTSQRMEN